MSYQYETLPEDYNRAYESVIAAIEDLKEELRICDSDFIEEMKKDNFDSLSIEGNQMSRKEVTYFSENDVTIRGKSIRDHLQVRNYSHMLGLLKELVSNPDVDINPDTIKTIHHIVTLGELKESECGQYRNEAVHIRYTAYIPPMEWEIGSAVEELCQKLYLPLNEQTMFERICEFKRNFERIHPFVDGNGRTGRILMNLLFLQNGYGYLSFPVEERDLYFSSLDNNTFHLYAADKMRDVLENIRENVRERGE